MYCSALTHTFPVDDHGYARTVCSCGAVTLTEPAERCVHGFGPDHPCVGCTVALGVYRWHGLRDGYGHRG